MGGIAPKNEHTRFLLPLKNFQDVRLPHRRGRTTLPHPMAMSAKQAFATQ
ncbi:unnamed protein product [Ectocarpus sp. CCAP 1310/34]|nr:unnamed protein product [Ectocarpus sp. CCAP 1310/34]